VRRLPALLLLLPLLVACASTAGGQAVAPLDTSPVVARVAGQAITVDGFARRLRDDIGVGIEELIAQGQTREQIEQLAADAQIRTRVFDQMIQDALLQDYARRNGIGVDAAAIDAEAPLPPAPDPSAPRDPAAAPTPTGAEIRLDTAQRQLVFEVIARQTRAEMVRARHILVADEAAADAALADLAAGAEFAALARDRSTDPGSAAQGGDLGWAPRGNYAPEFEEAVFTLPLNTPTKVESQFGWHVVEVLERQADRPFESFAQLRQSPNAQAYIDETFTPWFEALRAEAEASGELELAEGFDPNSVPLPFPDGT
jgi:peptidyl-prolyl cis-trans isomerase C